EAGVAEVDAEAEARTDAVAANHIARRPGVEDDDAAGVVDDPIALARRRSADHGVRRTVDAHTGAAVAQRTHPVCRKTDEVSAQNIRSGINGLADVLAAAAEGGVATDGNTRKPGVARHDIVENRVVPGAAEIDTARRVAEGGGARGIRADVVAGDQI